MRGPSRNRFACVRVAHFEAAAHERCEPGLRDVPLAVLAGTPPASRVVDANDVARVTGVGPGITHAEARARCPSLCGRPVSEERAAAARQALLDATLGVSPRVEDGGAGVVHVDIEGLERLIGDDLAIARRLVRAARAVGLEATVGIAGTRTAARVAATVAAPVTVVPPGEDRVWLRSVPLGVLDMQEPLAETFARWGITTLGALAALPRDGLAERLGPAGLRVQDEALGHDREPFRPYAPPPFWEEAQGLEWEIESWERLRPVLSAVLERLTARLAAAHVTADALEVRLELGSGAHDARTVALAYPLRDVVPMLTLIGLELEARPLAGAVTRVAVSAHAVRTRPAQGGLWHPSSPALRDLAATVARLAVLVGRERVGSPRLDDTHRPDSFTMAPFHPSAVEPAAGASPVEFPLAFRRLRPPRRVEVETVGDEPARLTLRDRAGGDTTVEVLVCAGPWRMSGDWWDTAGWAREEWDAVLADGMLCRLVHDRLGHAWYLDGAYD